MSHLSLKIATTISMQLKAAQTTHATIIIWQSLPTSPEVLVSSCFSKCAFSPPTLCFRHFTANCLQYLCSCHLYLSHILECIRHVRSKPKVNVKHNSVYITQPNFAVEKRRKSFSEFSKSYRLGVISFDPLSEVKTDLQSPRPPGWIDTNSLKKTLWWTFAQVCFSFSGGITEKISHQI